MDFFEVVEKRYSHKERFLPDAVQLEHLERIAAAGLAAPSGSNSQCVRLVILKNRAELQPFSDIFRHGGLESAPAAIAVLTDSSKQAADLNFELEDYSAATENMLLAAVALGYASLWLDYLFFDDSAQKLALKMLGAPAGYHLHVLMPIGVPDGDGTRREKLPFAERASYGKFGQQK